MKLNDIVAVSGLLLTLVTFLFNLAWPKITEALNQDEATSGDSAKKRCREKINKTLYGTVLPIFVAFFVLFYINLPSAVKVISSSEIAVWNFDVDDTLYVMVVYALAAFVIFNGSLLYRLFVKQSKFK
ncbi:hypothetical protein KIH87_13110 [Paraneptunicella aestuarii]|uniref:hypothetical protein n=1 Tax=Paraneptunicella aestuarii TaxID=2831148 RepID=UPI001E41913B|nr:hypothetical protein [Paraneptunicella aestuarii]UAA37645.1 hypothetical protein KIH87_13110 [Paraneptunicella aestuarii]